MTLSVNLPSQLKGRRSVRVWVTDCVLSGPSGKPLLDLTFLDEDFVARTGVKRLFITGVKISENGVGIRELGPFFDGRRTVRLVGCRFCGRPSDPGTRACPEWSVAACVLSS